MPFCRPALATLYHFPCRRDSRGTTTGEPRNGRKPGTGCRAFFLLTRLNAGMVVKGTALTRITVVKVAQRAEVPRF